MGYYVALESVRAHSPALRHSRALTDSRSNDPSFVVNKFAIISLSACVCAERLHFQLFFSFFCFPFRFSLLFSLYFHPTFSTRRYALIFLFSFVSKMYFAHLSIFFHDAIFSFGGVFIICLGSQSLYQKSLTCHTTRVEFFQEWSAFREQTVFPFVAMKSPPEETSWIQKRKREKRFHN